MPYPTAAARTGSIWTLPLASDQAILPVVGGKGANLARLARAGLPVPDGFMITVQAYEDFVVANDLALLIADLLSSPPALNGQFAEVSRQIRSAFSRGRIPDNLLGEIQAAYAALGNPPVAVRSSATAEDLPEMSFAGQQDTYLNVVGEQALTEAVINCWSSLWTERAIAYRAHNAVAHADAALAVVVQRMIESHSSGVLFTANPLTGLRTETVIDATFGLGEALVSGLVEPDHYVIDQVTGQITERTRGAKAVSVRGRPTGGTETVTSAGPQGQALPDPEIIALAALGRRVGDLYGAPQDIEWAWADERLYLLQARPITSLFPLPDGISSDPLLVLLSFGGMQGMLDPITPLGQDMIRQLVASAARIAGISVTRDTQTFLFTAGERLWMNLTPLMRNAIGRRIVPGMAGFLDPALKAGLAELMRDPKLAPGPRALSPRAARRLARSLLPLAGNVLLNIASPARRRRLIVDQGDRLLEEARQACARVPGDPRARLAGLAHVIPTLVDARLPHAFAMFVSGVASGMASYNLLRGLAGSLDHDLAGPQRWRERSLEILRGIPHNPTTEMDLALWQIAQSIRRDPSSLAAFQGAAPDQLAQRYRDGDLPETAQRAFAGFLTKYGSRGLAEIDLGRERWGENPEHVMDVISGYLRIADPGQAPDAVFARGAAAAAVVTDELVAAAASSRRGWLKARLLRFAAGRTRGLMSLRESPKFMIVRLFDIFRQELLAVGRGMALAGQVAEPDDLLYLKFSELAALAAAQTSEWQGLVARRRETYHREHGRRQIPRMLLSDGRAFYAGLQAPAESAGMLQGSPVSPGSAEGGVRVVFDPRHADLLPGEILVCRGTDPSWTPLFLTAGGLIMEVGGMMTHGAVVAREYGIPAIVSVDRATQRLQTGQRVQIDGSTGQIRLMDTD